MNDTSGTAGISCLPLKMIQVLSNNYKIFYNISSDITPEELCDITGNQSLSYQFETIPDDFIFISENLHLINHIKRITAKELLMFVS